MQRINFSYFVLPFATFAQISGSHSLLESVGWVSLSSAIKASKPNRGDSIMAGSHRDSLLTLGFMASKSSWLLGGHKASELPTAGFQLKKS